MSLIKLEKSWLDHLEAEFHRPYMKELRTFLVEEAKKGKIIYPQGDDIFAALNLTPFDQVKVVILGQDPYHGPGQAHGLSFSVRPGVKPPPSLQNIYQELHSDLGIKIPSHGHLEKWAHQGVLLLNTVLTVENGKAGSHQLKGWEQFTDAIIDVLNTKREHLVFILWGSPAQKKAAKVDPKKHCIIKSVHPSPLSAYRGFFGSRPFSKANHYLTMNGITPINWNL